MAAQYRSLLKALTAVIDTPHRVYFQREFRQLFELHAVEAETARTQKLHKVAEDMSQHLLNMKAHTETLVRYNITVNRDADQRQQVENIAKRVGLKVPDQADDGIPRGATQ